MSTQAPAVLRLKPAGAVVELTVRPPPAAAVPAAETTGHQAETGEGEGETGHCDDELLLLVVAVANSQEEL